MNYFIFKKYANNCIIDTFPEIWNEISTNFILFFASSGTKRKIVREAPFSIKESCVYMDLRNFKLKY